MFHKPLSLAEIRFQVGVATTGLLAVSYWIGRPVFAEPHLFGGGGRKGQETS